MHGDMVGFIALDFILWLLGIGVMGVSFVIHVSLMDLDNPAADASGLGIPADAVANFKPFRHFISRGHAVLTPPHSAASPPA